jgi:RNA polymerase-binding transcription factor DksA
MGRKKERKDELPMITAAQVQSLRRRLLMKGRDVSDRLAALLAGQTPSATDLVDAKPGETPIERLQRYLALVDRQIHATVDGSYGRCRGCGEPFSYESLAELPWAELCLRCDSRRA